MLELVTFSWKINALQYKLTNSEPVNSLCACVYMWVILIYLLHASITVNNFIFVAYNIGKCAVAGGAVVGLGALGYYGLGLSTSTGVIDYAKYVLF